jgi:hypothetical protein
MVRKVVDARTEEQRYMALIGAYDNEFKKWETRTKAIIKRFRDERTTTSGQTGARFNILWSNVQILVPAVFARLPQPDVSRRHKDNDPVGRVASVILERALEYEIAQYPDYRSAMSSCVQDRFLGGRGMAWVRYEPHIQPMDSPATDDGWQVTEDVENEGEEEAQTNEYLDIECSPVDYVAWADFGHEVARTWEEVTVVWRRVYMGREALVERFGEELGNKIPLDTKPPEVKKTDGSESHQAVVYEIWDKLANKAVWLSKSLNEILDTRVPGDDGLPQIEGFWPCPKPLYATTTNETLIPVPDFSLYQDQARSLDILAQRIDGLIKALKVRGVYDSATPELGRLFTEGENNTLIPVANWAAFAEKNGLKGAIDIVDIKPISDALLNCYTAVQHIKNEIYEITHISDIVRGSTDPNETLGAQQLKSQFASMPLKQMQSEVALFAQTLLQIKAQIICSQYSDETIIKISGAMQLQPVDQELIPQALQLLRDRPMRNFRIEIAADSLVQMDEQRERDERNAFLAAVAGYLKEALPAAAQSPALVPMLVEMLKFAVSAYKVGKTMEGVIDQAIEQLKQQAANPPPPQPDPAIQKAQIDAQAQAQQSQIEAQLEAQRMQMEGQLRARELQMEAALEQHRNELEAQREAQARQYEMQIEQHKALVEAAQNNADRQVQMILAKLDAMTKLEVAEIGAQTTLQTAQISAANAGSNEE